MKEPQGVGVGVASPPQPLAPSLARAGGVVALDLDPALPEPEGDFDGRADDLVQQGNGDDALKQERMYLHDGLRAYGFCNSLASRQMCQQPMFPKT